jgi:Helix-turn-helix domain
VLHEFAAMAALFREVPMSLEHSPERGAPSAASKRRRLFDPAEASDYLRVARQTLARWRCYGIGPQFVRIGGRIFYDPADLDAFIAANTFHSTAEADQAV